MRVDPAEDGAARNKGRICIIQQRSAVFKPRSFHVMVSREVRQVREVADTLPFANFADFA